MGYCGSHETKHPAVLSCVSEYMCGLWYAVCEDPATRRRPGITRDPHTSDPLDGQSGDTRCALPPLHRQRVLFFFSHASQAVPKNASEEQSETTPGSRDEASAFVLENITASGPKSRAAWWPHSPTAHGLIVGTLFGLLE